MIRPTRPAVAALAGLAALALPLVTDVAWAAAPPSASACRPSSTEPGSPIVTPAATGELGALAIEPALRITATATIVDAAYVPGGVVVATGAEAEGPITALTFVGESGAVRWQRCFDPGTYLNVFVAPPPAAPAQALLMLSSGTGSTIEVVDLARGTGTAAGFVTADMTFAASADGWLLLLTSTADGSIAPGAPLTLVDLATMTPTTLAAPEVPADVTYPSFQVNESGTVGLTASQGQSVALVYADGAWTGDAGTIDEAFGVWTDYSMQHPVAYWWASGREAWSVPELYFASDEGFHDATSGDVQLIRGCGAIDAQTFQCVGEVLAGFAAADGSPQWSLDGPHWVAGAADGFALVGGPLADGSPTDRGVTMIDVSTGDAVDGQVWPEGTFHVGCCGEPSFTTVDGGVVLTSDGHVLEVFVPLAAATPTVDVTL